MAVDLNEHIQELRRMLDKIKATIAALEAIQESWPSDLAPIGRSNRGRKFMAAEEREEVSARMKRYWAGRRQASKGAQDLSVAAPRARAAR
jgi:hypothetical protein